MLQRQYVNFHIGTIWHLRNQENQQEMMLLIKVQHSNIYLLKEK